MSIVDPVREAGSVGRIDVVGACERVCPSCVACRPQPPRPLEEVLARSQTQTLILGGGDATSWPSLDAFLSANAKREDPQSIWLEAPARAFAQGKLVKQGNQGERTELADLARRGVAGIRVQIEAVGEKMCSALGVGDGEAVLREAERLGLETRVLLCVRPKTFSALFGLAKRLAPKTVEVELVRQNWGEDAIPMHPELLDRALREINNVKFSATRIRDRGYLPACTLPQIWDSMPSVWRGTFGRDEADAAPNTTLAACKACVLNRRCHWSDAEALVDPDGVRPIKGDPEPWLRRGAIEEPVPAHIVSKRPATEVICTTPWTTMEIVDPDGRVHQCCSDWTEGDRGNINGSTLAEVWNGPGYRSARRIMSGDELSPLCRAICSRLYDRKFAESELRVQAGSKRFVDNQLLLYEDIAERRDVMRARPLTLSICPSTYCNYDCIMCLHGRSPRRELPDSVWDEIPEYLPTLKSLTLLGGEPFAHPKTMELLRNFDVEKYPDAVVDVITNASLLTEKTLSYLSRCTFGNLTISMNAGDADTYERVQRGLSFETVVSNIDALIRFRAGHHRWFGITLSFVAQPAAIDSVIAFAELARVRNIPIRLMALNTEQVPELDFYTDEARVAHVVERLDELVAYCRRLREDWLPEAQSAREAVLAEASSRGR